MYVWSLTPSPPPQIDTLSPLSRLSQLAVLNASSNNLAHVEGVARLLQLKALILNNNKLKRIPHLAKLKLINTLGMSWQWLLLPLHSS